MFRNKNFLGKGKFGKVIEVEDSKGDKFALKIIEPTPVMPGLIL